MKKVLVFCLFCLLISISIPVYAAEGTNSSVGITFQPPTNNSIPMQKIAIPDEQNKTPSSASETLSMFPKTNDNLNMCLTFLGVVIVSLTLFLKRRGKYAD